MSDFEFHPRVCGGGDIDELPLEFVIPSCLLFFTVVLRSHQVPGGNHDSAAAGNVHERLQHPGNDWPEVQDIVRGRIQVWRAATK